MKKVLFTVLCLLLIGTQFLSAGGSQQTGSSKDGVTVVKVWSNDAHNKGEYTKIVDEFNAGKGAEMGIKIEYTVYGGDYYTVLDLAIAAGEEPHLFKTNKWPQFVQEGRLIPQTELPAWYQTEIVDRYRPFMIEGNHMFNGEVYNLPAGGSAYCTIAYNVELLASIGLTEAPKTWAEFEKASIEIAKKNPRKFGAYIPLKYSNFHLYYTEPVLISSYGHTWFDFTNNRYCFTDFVDYFEMYQRMYQAGALFPGIESLDDDTARAQFSEGNIAFVMENPSFNVGVFYDQFPAKMEWKVASIPLRDPNNYYHNQGAAGAAFAISTKVREEGITEQVARAYAVLMSDELAMTLFTAGKDLPRLPEHIENAAPSTRPQWNDIAKLNIGSVARPGMPDAYFAVEGDDVHTAFSKIFVGGNAREILADLEKRYNEAYDKAAERGIVSKEYFYRPTFAERLQIK
ncbi:MAG: extracellular solute-binding protein [Treponema sp.]|nr:extracellular solute-binding protein [Treponema sp.]